MWILLLVEICPAKEWTKFSNSVQTICLPESRGSTRDTEVHDSGRSSLVSSVAWVLHLNDLHNQLTDNKTGGFL